MAFKDNFSLRSAAYAKYRPHYPVVLFDYLARLASATTLAWGSPRAEKILQWPVYLRVGRPPQSQKG